MYLAWTRFKRSATTIKAPHSPLASATGSCSFFRTLFKSKQEFAKTVPGFALFMVPYEHKIRSSPPSPAACVQRTHSSQSGHHEEGRWGAEVAVWSGGGGTST